MFLHSFGSSGALSFFARAGDQHQPQVRQGPHPICRLHAAEGPLQGDNQVTAKKIASIMTQCFVFYFSAAFPKLNPLPLTLQKRRCTCNRERQGAFDSVCSFRSSSAFSAAPGYLIVWDDTLGIKLLSLLLQVETYKSFRPGDIVLAKVVSFTCPRI